MTDSTALPSPLEERGEDDGRIGLRWAGRPPGASVLGTGGERRPGGVAGRGGGTSVRESAAGKETAASAAARTRVVLAKF